MGKYKKITYNLLTCNVQLVLFCKNSTNLGTIPVCITSSIGGFGSRLNNFLNFCVATNCSSTLLLYNPATICCVTPGCPAGDNMSTSDCKKS